MISKTAAENLFERILWLTRLRWAAIVGVVFAVATAMLALKMTLPLFPLSVTVSALIAYNLLFSLWLGRLKKTEAIRNYREMDSVANWQISLDLISLVALIHFSGGIENPFIFYFIFHVIIASILLSRRAAFLQTSFAVALFLTMVLLEYRRVIDHYYLKSFMTDEQYGNPLYMLGISFVFVSTLYIAAYMATSISKRLRERETSLEEANLRLNEQDRVKSEYVLRVSHDIKEHLSAIQGCVETVASGITGALNEKQKNLLQRAYDRTNKLTIFVRALLEVTRIKLARDIEFTRFSLKKTVENAVNVVEPNAKIKGVVLKSSIGASIDTVNGAQVYIEETIANILANSVKYTPSGGSVSIGVEDRGLDILIKVTDTGIGIPRNEIGKVFDEFYRATNARQTEKNGTGLGLSIAKQVITRHGGKIWIESEEGRGSTVSIILPK